MLVKVEAVTNLSIKYNPNNLPSMLVITKYLLLVNKSIRLTVTKASCAKWTVKLQLGQKQGSFSVGIQRKDNPNQLWVSCSNVVSRHDVDSI